MFSPKFNIAKYLKNGMISNDAPARRILQKLTRMTRKAHNLVTVFYETNKRMSRSQTNMFEEFYKFIKREWDRLDKMYKTPQLVEKFHFELICLKDFIFEAGYRGYED